MTPAKNEYHTKIPYGHRVLYKWFLLLEDSLITMQWLRKTSHKRKDLYSKKWYDKWVKNREQCTVLSREKRYLQYDIKDLQREIPL